MYSQVCIHWNYLICVLLAFIPIFFKFTEHVHPYHELSLIIWKVSWRLMIFHKLPFSCFSFSNWCPISIHCSIHHWYILCRVYVPFCEIVPCRLMTCNIGDHYRLPSSPYRRPSQCGAHRHRSKDMVYMWYCVPSIAKCASIGHCDVDDHYHFTSFLCCIAQKMNPLVSACVHIWYCFLSTSIAKLVFIGAVGHVGVVAPWCWRPLPLHFCFNRWLRHQLVTVELRLYKWLY